jgi:sulfide:quinone oxidoreductase
MPRRPPLPRVLVVGGGVAALETVLALRELVPDLLRIDVLTASPDFVYRPVSVAEPFERGEARRFSWEVIGGDRSVTVHHGELALVDPIQRRVNTRGNLELSFDLLVVAIGARAVNPLPGALVFRGGEDVAVMRDLLAELQRGDVRRVVFTMPSSTTWPLPLYELTLMTASHLHARRVRGAELVLVSPEDDPLDLFGPAGADALTPLLADRGIFVRMRSRAASVEPGGLALESGGFVPCDRVVTLPQLEGRRVLGPPQDRLGFVPVDAHGLVLGLSDVYAAGDGTSYPLKQGGLAAQQADAVAEAIAERVGAPVHAEPFRPVIRGLLLTGTQPRYLRADPTGVSRAWADLDEDPRPQPSRAHSDASTRPLWWPPAKIAGRYLAPYLATARPHPLAASPLRDRPAPPPSRQSDAERTEAGELALLIADHDARWGDYALALRALEAAEAIEGVLPAEYEAKRRQWREAAAS